MCTEIFLRMYGYSLQLSSMKGNHWVNEKPASCVKGRAINDWNLDNAHRRPEHRPSGSSGYVCEALSSYGRETLKEIGDKVHHL